MIFAKEFKNTRLNTGLYQEKSRQQHLATSALDL